MPPPHGDLSTAERPLIHLGFPKCASSFLQTAVFPRADGLFVGPNWYTSAFDAFVLTDAADFDAAAVRRQFSPPTDSDAVAVLSNENFVGGAAARYDWLEPTADRFAATFPDARVVMVVREQRSMALSLYRQLVRRGESLRLADAITPTGAAGYYPRVRLERLRYDVALDTYVQRFGADQVLVVPMEHLVKDSAEFVRTIVSFGTGRPVEEIPGDLKRENVGYRGLTLEFRRRLNRVCGENYTGPGGAPWSYRAAKRATRVVDAVIPPARHDPREAAMRDEVARVVGTMFADSNRILAERTGLDLAGLGYLV